jgi:hypothetical protein
MAHSSLPGASGYADLDAIWSRCLALRAEMQAVCADIEATGNRLQSTLALSFELCEPPMFVRPFKAPWPGQKFKQEQGKVSYAERVTQHEDKNAIREERVMRAGATS